MQRMHGRIAVVTGGASGIGRAISLAFAREGARVAVLDLRADAASAVAGEAEGERLWLRRRLAAGGAGDLR